MIRIGNGDHAVDDLENYFHTRKDELLTWMSLAIERREAYPPVETGRLYVESIEGRKLGVHEASAINWILTVLYDYKSADEELSRIGRLEVGWESTAAEQRSRHLAGFEALARPAVREVQGGVKLIDRLCDHI